MQTTWQAIDSTRMRRDPAIHFGLWISLFIHVALGIVLATAARVSQRHEAPEFVEVAEFHLDAPVIADARAREEGGTVLAPAEKAVPPMVRKPKNAPAPAMPQPQAPSDLSQPAAPQDTPAPVVPARDVADRIDPAAPADAPIGNATPSPSTSTERADAGVAGGAPGGIPGGTAGIAGTGNAARGSAEAPGGQGGTGTGQGGGGSRELWTEYGEVLQRACEKFKRYPPMALSRGWQGDAEVEIQRSVEGAVSLSIRRSAGRKVLDDEAMGIVRQGMAELPVPEKFRRRPLTLHIVIRFRIAD